MMLLALEPSIGFSLFSIQVFHYVASSFFHSPQIFQNILDSSLPSIAILLPTGLRSRIFHGIVMFYSYSVSQPAYYISSLCEIIYIPHERSIIFSCSNMFSVFFPSNILTNCSSVCVNTKLHMNVYDLSNCASVYSLILINCSVLLSSLAKHRV